MRPFVKRFHTEFNLTLKSPSCKKVEIISLGYVQYSAQWLEQMNIIKKMKENYYKTL